MAREARPLLAAARPGHVRAATRNPHATKGTPHSSRRAHAAPRTPPTLFALPTSLWV